MGDTNMGDRRLHPLTFSLRLNPSPPPTPLAPTHSPFRRPPALDYCPSIPYQLDLGTARAG